MEGARRLIGSHRERSCCPAGAVLCYGTPLGLGRSYPTQIQWAFTLICVAVTFMLEWRLRALRIAHTSVRTAHLFVEELNELPLWPWFAAIVVLSFATAYLIMMWDKIPSRFPFHWNHAGPRTNGRNVPSEIVFRPLLIVSGGHVDLRCSAFQRWFLCGQWSTFGQMMAVRHLLVFASSHIIHWVALDPSVAVSLSFRAKLDSNYGQRWYLSWHSAAAALAFGVQEEAAGSNIHSIACRVRRPGFVTALGMASNPD